MGTKEVLNVNFTDTTLPVVKNDPVITNGSLFLFDVGHSLGTLAAGTTSGTAMKNIVETEARAVVGGSDSLNTVLSVNPGPSHFIERTPKLGIHCVHAQPSDYASNPTQIGTFISIPTAINNFVAANVGHLYYISVWERLTRTALTAGQPYWISQYGWSSSITANYIYARRPTGWQGNVAKSSFYPSNSLNTVTGVPYRHSGQTSGVRTGSSTAGSIQAYIWTIGTIGTENSYLEARINQPAAVFYRSYMEDLTVSGRTFEQVEALDQLAYDKAFGVGGRYYGDTIPTTPAAVPNTVPV